MDIKQGVNPLSADAIFAELFGDQERQRALSELLSSLLQSHRAFVLTANSGYVMIARLLNMLLLRSGAAGTMQFVVDQNIQYVPAGGKIRAIQKIVDAHGYRLVATYRYANRAGVAQLP